MLATLLKARQNLGRFPTLDEVHTDTVTYMALQLGLTTPIRLDQVDTTKSFYRYQTAVRNTFPSRRMATRLRSWLPRPHSKPPKP